MVVQFEAGDLFLTDAQTIAHGCNCAGRMGKGIAEEIKSRFPEMFLEYRRRCEVGSFKPGTAYLEKSTAPWVLNLATQDTARGAQLSYVVVCLQWIADHFESVGMTSLSMPRIGAGLGGLRWVDVRRTIIEILDPIDLPVVVYEEFLSGVKAPESIFAPVGSESREPEDSPVLFGRHHANFRELSNFFPSTISIDGKEYPTVEHYYQASKAMDAAHHEIIRSAASPKKARKLGREILAIWPDWEARKIDVMRRALRAKFSQHHQLRDVLLSTGGRPIREDSPQDAEWGWQNGEGRDLLGKLLMEVRAELKSGMREQQTRTIVEED